jgi:PAS domain S-box-containing protein
VIPINIEMAKKITENNSVLESEEKYRALFESVNTGIFIINKKTKKIVDLNKAGYNQLGYIKKDLIGKSILSIYPKEILPIVEKQIKKLIKEKKVIFETQQKKKDGSLINVEVKSAIFVIDGEEVFQSIVTDITERKKTELEIEKTKEELTNIVEYADIGIVYTNSEKEVISANKKFVNILGYKEERDILGKTIMSFTHPDDIEKDLAQVVRLENIESSTFNMEKRYIRKDKSIVWVNLNVSTIEDEFTGKVTNFIGMVTDITGRKITEEGIIKTNSKLELIANNIGDIVYKITLDAGVSKIDYISNNVMDIIGFTTEDYVNGNPKLVKSMRPERYAEAVEFNKMIKTLKKAKPHSFDYEWYNPIKKKWLWMKETIVPEIQDGKVVGQFGTVRDITEKKIWEEKLMESEERYKSLYDKNLAGVYRADMNDVFLDCNEEFAKIMGVSSPRQVIGKNAKDLYNNLKKSNFVEDVMAIGGKIKAYQSFIKLKSGEELYILENGAITSDEKGEPLYMEGTVFDISEIKNSQQAMIESESRLKLATSSASIGIWDWDVKNDVLVWDDSMYELFEVKKKDFSGAYEAWEKTLYVHDVVDATKELEKALSGEKKFDTVFRIVTAKGNIKYIQARANVDFNDKGKAIRMVGVNIDVTNKELMEQEKYNAIIKTEEAERQRISHDLHDGLGQRIAAANMWINTLESLVEGQLDKETMSVFKAGKKLINSATKETRLVSHNIMPRSLKQYGLENTVKELVNNLQQIHDKILINLTSSIGSRRFDAIKELSIFRVIQESINNALKHSKADKIDVILSEDQNLLFVKVNDNGKGFNVKEVTDKKILGIGLLSLSQRIKMIGGKLRIVSEPNQGTKIIIAIYLEKPAAVLRK